MEITGTFVALVPIVMALVEIVRNIGLKTQYAPLLAVILGVLGACGLGGFSFPIALSGIVVGLSASGLYSGVKTTVQG